METGNPKQLVVLGVMAVGAIGFLAVRLGGKSQAPVSLANALAKREAKAAPTASFAIGRDPFSHPRLALKELKHIQNAASPFPGATLGDALPAVKAPAPLGGPFTPVGPLASAGPELPLAKGEDEAKKDAKRPEPRPATSIGLEAIAGTAEDRVAFLSVGGADSQPFRPKDSIAGAVRLLRVGDGTVVVEGPGGRATLEVGDKRSL